MEPTVTAFSFDPNELMLRPRPATNTRNGSRCSLGPTGPRLPVGSKSKKSWAISYIPVERRRPPQWILDSFFDGRTALAPLLSLPVAWGIDPTNSVAALSIILLWSLSKGSLP